MHENSNCMQKEYVEIYFEKIRDNCMLTVI